MKRSLPVSLALLLTLLMALPAFARKERTDKPVPDLTGVWKGTSQSVAMGKLGHADAADELSHLVPSAEDLQGRAHEEPPVVSRSGEGRYAVVTGGAPPP